MRREWSSVFKLGICALSGINWQDKIGKAIELLTNGLGGAMNTVITVVSSVFSGIVTAFMSIVESKQKIKVIFLGGLEVEAEVEQ